MTNGKKSFILYSDLIHTVEIMPDDKAGLLFKHILQYVNGANPTTEDLIVQLTFEPIRQQLKRDKDKWESELQGKSESGQWGNIKRHHPEIYDLAKGRELSLCDALRLVSEKVRSQKVAKVAVNVNVNDNVSVNDNVNVKEKKEDSPVKPAFPDFSKLESWMVEPLKIWFDYKKEKKQGYKPIGWNSLVEKIRKEYSNEAELMEAVKYSTSKNYTGLFRESKPAQQTESTAVTDDIDRYWKQ